MAKDMAKVSAYRRMKNNAKYAVGLLGKLVVPVSLERWSLIQNMKTTIMKQRGKKMETDGRTICRQNNFLSHLLPVLIRSHVVFVESR